MLDLVLSITLSFLISLFLTPLMIHIAKKKNIMDMPSGRKAHTEPMPLLGGAAIYLGTIASFILFTKSSAPYVLPILILGATGVSFMGFIDDLLSLSAKRRLIILFLIALIVFFACIQFYFYDQYIISRSTLSIVIFSFFILVWIVGITNAINFSDGLDGLASYLSIVSAISFAILFAYQGRDMLALPMSLALIGAIAGFIPYNRNPAMIFMGDTGSMFIGFMLSLLSLSSVRHEKTLFAIIVPIYLLIVPMLDMGMSVLRRLLSGKPIMAPDKMHFHHQLNKRFHNHIIVVIILSSIQILFSAAGILIFISKAYTQGWIILGMIVLLLLVYTAVSSLRHKSESSEQV